MDFCCWLLSFLEILFSRAWRIQCCPSSALGVDSLLVDSVGFLRSPQGHLQLVMLPCQDFKRLTGCRASIYLLLENHWPCPEMS